MDVFVPIFGRREKTRHERLTNSISMIEPTEKMNILYRLMRQNDADVD